MSKINLFNEKNIILLNPFFLESLYHLIVFFKESHNDITNNKIKEFTFDTICYLIDNKLIYFINENQFFQNKKIVKITISKSEIKELIFNITSNLTFEELYFLPWFVFSDWYKKKLLKLGLTEKSDWVTFLSLKNIDLEIWIKENKV